MSRFALFSVVAMIISRETEHDAVPDVEPRTRTAGEEG